MSNPDSHYARGEQHWSAKLTAGKVRDIRQRFAADSKVKLGTLAAEFGVSKVAIFKVIHRESWAHVE